MGLASHVILIRESRILLFISEDIFSTGLCSIFWNLKTSGKISRVVSAWTASDIYCDVTSSNLG